MPYLPNCGRDYDEGLSLEHDALIAAQATAAENKRVLDEFSRAWRSGSCPNPMAPCSMDDGKNYCPICIAETLRLAQPEPKEREPE
jgi:hypothetical protein